jgi:hypothetical protein
VLLFSANDVAKQLHFIDEKSESEPQNPANPYAREI